ncbi:MAG: phosphoglycerate kinase, partial [Candidatus Magasanikbacteria bacterium RIFCSPHIGHO2_02_FULL_47_14]
PGYAGLLLEREVTGLDTLLHRPKAPFVVVLGGAKMETKIPVLKNLLPRATCVLLGGGVIN